MDLDEIVRVVRAALPDVLVAVDFDGTLAPLRPDPEDSRVVPGTIEALTALATLGAQVAVVTGRDALTVLRLGGFDAVPGIVVAGLYGVETWSDGTLHTPETPDPMAQLQQRLPGVLAAARADEAVWIEDKRLSLVVHGRMAADPEAVLDPLREPVAALAADLELELHPGNGVLELRLPGHDKADALHRLTSERAFRAVLYVGDDLGDVPAFEQVARLRAGGIDAFGVGVRSTGVAEVAAAADVLIDGPADVVRLLQSLAG